jgi:ABC-2 type transport system ATP-binding protein
MLAIVQGQETGREILVRGEMVVGRDPTGDVVIADPEVSSRHAQLTSGNGTVSVEDIGSSNGTFVNGQRVTGRRELAPGDRVTFGATVLEVRLSEDPAEAAAAHAVTRERAIPMPPVLVFGSGPNAGSEVPVAGAIVVGREGTADLVLEDTEISRRHAVFSPAGAGLTVEDLGSTNGTYVNGHRITGAVVLTTGDRVDLGSSAIEVRLAQAPVPGAVQAPSPAYAATATNSIEVEGLYKQFKDGPRAVDGVDLYVAPGAIYGFLGPNGAGKSTTVHMLTTLLPPSGGIARVSGYDVATQGAQVRASIGVALQAAALDPMLNSWEHMALQTALQGVPKNERRRRAEELLERVGLIYAADRRAGGYSGGMKRRLDLALALVHRPQVLFLDEPTTGLDPQSRTALWEEVNRLAKQEGMTVFLTTQYLEEADVLADEIAIIDHGEIVARGTPTELKAEIGRPTVEALPANPDDWNAIVETLQRFGELSTSAHKGVAVKLQRGIDDLAEVVRALDAAGLRVANLELHAPTLDDVFMAKTGRTLEGAGDAEPEPEPEPEQRGAVAQMSGIGAFTSERL